MEIDSSSIKESVTFDVLILSSLPFFYITERTNAFSTPTVELRFEISDSILEVKSSFTLFNNDNEGIGFNEISDESSCAILPSFKK
jgi:hypothetical protein